MSVVSTTRRRVPRARLGATVDAHSFKKALDRVQPAVDGRSSLAVCHGVLVEATEGRLNITATETGLTIRTRIPANTWSGGAVVVPFKHLHSIASSLRGDLELAVDGRLLLDGAMRAALQCASARDFPPTPRLARGGAPVDVRILRDVLPAAKARGSGVLFDGTEIVAGDAEHLHVGRTSSALPPCHLPRSAVAAIVGAGVRQLRVLVDETGRRAQFVAPDTFYIVDLIDRSALDPRDLVSADADRNVVATVEAKDVLESLRRLRPLLGNDPPPVWMAVEATQLRLTVTSPEGSGSIEMRAQVRGIDEPLDIPFHPRRLAAYIASSRARRVSIHLRDAHTPAVMVADGVDWRSGESGARFLAPDRRALTTVETVTKHQTAAGLGDNVVCIELARASRRSSLEKGGVR